jgi:serine protease AprX
MTQRYLAILRFLAVALIPIISAPAAWGQRHDQKLASDIPLGDPEKQVTVLVRFNKQPSPESFKKLHGRGAQLRHRLNLIPAAVVQISAGALRDLAADAEIAYISPDRPVSASIDYSSEAVGADIALRSYGLTGVGMAVAIIDSGISRQPALLDTFRSRSRVVYQESFVPGVYSAGDQFGHGTHVAGVLAGNGLQSTGPEFFRTFRGIASNVNIVNLRALDAKGQGTDSTVIAAIERAIELKNKYNIRVLNLSLGRPVYESYQNDPLCQAVEAAWKANIVVVVAAGNGGRDDSRGTQGYGTINSPGNDPYVITVGAMKTMGTIGRWDDRIASYSSKGPTAIDHIAKPDLVAPGNQVISLIASGSTVNKNSLNKIPWSYYRHTTSPDYSSAYYRLSGTSMATPMVSGAAVLLLERNPTLTPDQVKARLMRTAYKTFPSSSITADPESGVLYQNFYDIFTVGAGYLDIEAALTDNHLASKPARSPVVAYDAAARRACIVYDPSTVWGDSALWEDVAIWGDLALWGDVAMWGNNGTSGFSAVWGDSALWGDSTSTAEPSSLNLLLRGEN